MHLTARDRGHPRRGLEISPGPGAPSAGHREELQEEGVRELLIVRIGMFASSVFSGVPGLRGGNRQRRSRLSRECPALIEYAEWLNQEASRDSAR